MENAIAGKPPGSAAAGPGHAARQAGFATATVIMLLVLSIVGGAYVLKLTRSQAAASGGYYQARSAALAAQAGLERGLAQLEADPAGSLALLNGYLADTTRHWLLGDPDSRNEVEMDNGLQSYAARIMAFDPATGMVKLEGQGEGPGGSESRIYGVYRLGGLAPDVPALAKYVWFMAGESRNIDQEVHVRGDSYFGGGVHFNGGADGTYMHGTVKIARGAGLQSSIDADLVFCGNTYIQTPFKSQGPGVKFDDNAGFEDEIFIDTDPVWRKSGKTVYVNADVTGGHSNLDLSGTNRVVHSGSLNTGRVQNAAAIVNSGRPIDIAAALGMEPGPESELSVDMSAVPAAFKFTPAALGIAQWGNTSGIELTAAYADAKARGRLFRDFLIVQVNTPLNFMQVPGNVLRGKFVFNVTAQVNMNINLPESDPASVSLWQVVSGGSIFGFGGNGLFRGYVNVSGTGAVVYQWGPGCEFQGAIHHVSPGTGFQLNGSTGPLWLTFSSGVFEELYPLGVLLKPGAAPPASPSLPGPGRPGRPGTPPVAAARPPQVKLVDIKIRPFFRGRYF